MVAGLAPLATRFSAAMRKQCASSARRTCITLHNSRKLARNLQQLDDSSGCSRRAARVSVARRARVGVSTPRRERRAPNEGAEPRAGEQRVGGLARLGAERGDAVAAGDQAGGAVAVEAGRAVRRCAAPAAGRRARRGAPRSRRSRPRAGRAPAGRCGSDPRRARRRAAGRAARRGAGRARAPARGRPRRRAGEPESSSSTPSSRVAPAARRRAPCSQPVAQRQAYSSSASPLGRRSASSSAGSSSSETVRSTERTREALLELAIGGRPRRSGRRRRPGGPGRRGRGRAGGRPRRRWRCCGSRAAPRAAPRPRRARRGGGCPGCAAGCGIAEPALPAAQRARADAEHLGSRVDPDPTHPWSLLAQKPRGISRFSQLLQGLCRRPLADLARSHRSRRASCARPAPPAAFAA